MSLRLLALLSILAGCTAPAAPPVAMSPVATSPAATVAVASPSQTTAPAAQPGPTWPLRGTPAPDADAIKRRPVVAKVGNDKDAHPQAGLDRADVVFELEAEFGITRLALVFHSQDAESIGPIRSARLSDLEIMPILRGIIAHVGAEPETMSRVRDAARRGEFVDVDEFFHGRSFDRIRERPAPHNTFTSTKRIREAARDTAKVDVPAFVFGEPPPGGKPASAMTLPYAGPEMKVTYEPAGSGFMRAQGERTTGVTPVNVIVIKTDIRETYVVDAYGSRAHEVRTTGDGPVVVLSAGQRFEGKWTRSGKEQFRFADAAGNEIRLRPGLTWIHIVPLAFEIQ